MPDDAYVERAIESAAGWITAQRWFGDKGRPLASLRVERFAPLDGEAGMSAFAIVRCAFETGEDVRYFVPVSWHDGGEPVVRDALSDSLFLAWLYAGFQEERTLASEGRWTWTQTAGSGGLLDGIDVHRSRLMDVEQSNSSALFDNRVMLKVFRRLQPGVNPDLEVTRYLTVEAGFRYVPALYGMLEGEFGGESFVLGVLQEFVPNRGDCWGWFGKTLRALTPRSLDAAVDAVGLLGQRTAEMHVALARPTSDPAFAPQPIDPDYADETVRRVRAELEETGTLLRSASISQPQEDVTGLLTGLQERLASAEAMVGTLRTRIHGDYHLGQVLRTLEDDYAIIDFEGEPSRPIVQRREKYPPLRDVAGMLRSIGYAAGSLRKEDPDPALLSLVDAWESRARQVYLERYRQVVGASGLALVPADDDAFDAALHILEIEKSLYEARYEVNNRPDWLDIPMSALRHLATGDRM